MRRFSPLFILLIIIGLALIATIFVLPIFRNNNSILQVETPGVVAKAYLNNEEVGETPFLGQKLKEGDHDLKLEATLPDSDTTVEFSRKITLTSQAVTTVNYEFGPTPDFSSGDIRSSRSGDGLSIITHPSGAKITLNGEDVGEGPTSLNPMKGVHKLTLSADGYFSREMEINIEPGKRLIVEVFLALDSIGKPKTLQSGKITVYDLSSSIENLNSNIHGWAEGIFFFDSKKNLSFDLLIDSDGETVFKDKEEFGKKLSGGKAIIVGYLGNSPGKGLSASAKAAIASTTKQTAAEDPSGGSQAKVQILQTPTGTLNVRSGPGTSNSIVAKVNPGDTYNLISEQSSWYKIKLPSGEGWISSQYAKKL